MRHIVLIGFMGCGKSTVGESLAKQLGRPYADTDSLIEQEEGMSIRQIFKDKGEAYFRTRETEVLKRFYRERTAYVISVGGGLPIRKDNRSYLKEIGEVIYMKTNTDVLKQRLQGDSSRPVLEGGELKQRINALLEEREPLYEAAATKVLDVNNMPVGKIVEKIVEILG